MLYGGLNKLPENECQDASNVDEFAHLDLFICSSFHLLYGGLNKLPEMNVRMHRM
jgi:hypothetical protein